MNRILPVLLVSMISITTAFSQNDSLYSYIEKAVRNNPGLQQKFTAYRAALSKVPQSGSLPDPQLNISYFLMPMELMNGKQVAEMSIMQMFPWFGVLSNAKDEMANMAMARFEEYRQQGIQLAYDVQSTWYELYRVRKTIAITGKNAQILKTIEDIALTRYRTSSTGPAAPAGAPVQRPPSQARGSAGGSSMQGMSGSRMPSGRTAPQSMPMASNQMDQQSGSGLADLYRLKMETADLENSLSNLADEDQTLMARFNLLLNRQQDHPVFIPDTIAADTIYVNKTLDAAVHGSNPMLGMIEYEKKAYAAREKMSRSMGFPMVGLGLGYAIMGSTEMSVSEMNGKDMVMPMVSVSVPIWRKKYRAQREEASLLAQSASQQYMSVSNDLQTEHNEAIRSYENALRRIKLYKGQKALASNTMDLLRTRLSVSSAGLTDILRVQQQLLDYEIREVEAVTDLNKAISLLQKIMATSLDELNLKNIK